MWVRSSLAEGSQTAAIERLLRFPLLVEYTFHNAAQLRRAELTFTASCRPEAAMAVDTVVAPPVAAYVQKQSLGLERRAAIEAPEPQGAP